MLKGLPETLCCPYSKIVQVSPGENFPSHPRDQRTDENFWFDMSASCFNGTTNGNPILLFCENLVDDLYHWLSCEQNRLNAPQIAYNPQLIILKWSPSVQITSLYLWALWCGACSEDSNGAASADLSLVAWLNTITDPPFHTEKINFLRKINEKSSIFGRVRASQRAAVLAVGLVYNCGENDAL